MHVISYSPTRQMQGTGLPKSCSRALSLPGRVRYANVWVVDFSSTSVTQNQRNNNNLAPSFQSSRVSLITTIMIPLTWNEALSGITGSISLAAWIFLLLPQLVENYTAGSADGISLTFLFIWFIGDVTNLAGAIWADLVPTVTALAVYFCFADAVLIGQCVYYNTINRRREETKGEEEAPLLNGHPSPTTSHKHHHTLGDVRNDNLGLPGSRRRSSAASSKRSLHRTRTTDSTATGTLSPIREQSPPQTRTYLKNTLSVLLILTVGTAGWAIAWRAGAWRPTPLGHEDGQDEATPLGASILGYISAVAYLGARIPQIVKNQRERSCDGLSLLFFMLSLLGNLTYGAGILFHSVEQGYLVKNAPWLIGSLGTMVEDAIIFVQFRIFGERVEAQAEEAVLVE